MTRTNNLSNTQFGYQIVFFIHVYGYVWLAEGCLWHLLPRQCQGIRLIHMFDT